MSRCRVFFSAIVPVLLLSLAACGGDSANPASSPVTPTTPTQSPAPTPTPTPSGGAVVSGSVSVGSGASTFSSRLASTSYAITVSVTGTTLSTSVDGAGRFKLTGVPSGRVELRFSGSANGSVTLADVKDTDAITVTVTLESTGASLESEERDNGGSVQLEGRITAVKPGGAANTLLVQTTTVSVPAGTDIRHGSTPIAFSALEVGDRVHVSGTKNGDVLVANQVIDQNEHPTVPVNASGAVSGLQSGFTCPVIRFTVEGWVIDTDAATAFEKGSCSSIANGTSVHVKGVVQSTGRVLATWVQIGR